MFQRPILQDSDAWRSPWQGQIVFWSVHSLLRTWQLSGAGKSVGDLESSSCDWFGLQRIHLKENQTHDHVNRNLELLVWKEDLSKRYDTLSGSEQLKLQQTDFQKQVVWETWLQTWHWIVTIRQTSAWKVFKSQILCNWSAEQIWATEALSSRQTRQGANLTTDTLDLANPPTWFFSANGVPKPLHERPNF